MKLLPLILAVLAFILTGCITRTDVTTISPYSAFVGQQFVLNEDCYTYHLGRFSKKVKLGSPKLDGDVLRALQSNSIPKRSGEIVIIGRVPKNSTFVVTKVIREHTIEGSWYFYVAVLTTTDGQSGTVDVTGLMDPLKDYPLLMGGIATPKQ